MATQQTGTPPNTRRMGIFPDSIRKLVIVFMIVLFVIAGIIGVIGILQGWDIVFNVLFMVFAVTGVILAILTFWPSNNPNEASATASPVSPRQLLFKSIISLTWGQQAATQQIPSSSNELGGQRSIPDTNAINTQQQPSKNLQNMPTGNYLVSPVQRDESPLPYAKPRTDGAGGVRKKKPDNLDTHIEKPGAENRGLEESLPNTLRDCVERAQQHVSGAYDLLNPKMNILPEDIANATEFLEAARGNIEHLEELLQENPPHSEHGRIIDQVRIIIDQINEFVIPQLKTSVSVEKNFQKRFVPLLNALNRLDILIPE
jgi:hypothetical protein